jgi:cytochrome c oxidase subunit 2
MDQPDNRNHFLRVMLWWLIATLICTPIVVFVLAPGMPPGSGSVEASGQVTDNTVLMGLATPVTLAVLVFFVYAMVVFRERDQSAVLDGPPIRGHASVQLWWLVTTTSLVLILAGYGSIRLLADGAGGGQGPNPIAAPALAKGQTALQVQVVAQQWQFTYRYPGYGGFETAQLEIPENTTVEFHVTSLDVIHSFWAYQLGVKADANPGIDNIAYVTTKGPLTFNVRCAELCGVFHGYMFNTGRVVSKTTFASWAQQQEAAYAPATKALGPYSKQYYPQPNRRGG